MESKLQWEDETEKEKSGRRDKENGGVYASTKNKIWKEAYRAKGRRQWELGGQDKDKEQTEIEAK